MSYILLLPFLVLWAVSSQAQVAASFDGGVRVGNDTRPCTSALTGSIRWTGSQFHLCTGTVWVVMVQGT